MGVLKPTVIWLELVNIITLAVISQYSGPDFTVMPTGIMSNVNARLVKRGKYI